MPNKRGSGYNPAQANQSNSGGGARITDPSLDGTDVAWSGGQGSFTTTEPAIASAWQAKGWFVYPIETLRNGNTKWLITRTNLAERGLGSPEATATTATDPNFLGAEGPKQSSPRTTTASRTQDPRQQRSASPDVRRDRGTTNIAVNEEARAQRQAAAQALIDAAIASWENIGLNNARQIAQSLMADGYSATQAMSLLRERVMDSSQYKNLYGSIQDAQRKAGLPVMSPESIQTQRSTYMTVMRRAGLPKGFYDDTSDFDQFLIQDISPDEIASRIATAQQVVGQSVAPETAKAFKKYFGIGKGDLIAYFLDPDRAEPLLQKQAEMALIGGEGISSGVQGLGGKKFTENLVEKGISQAGARQAFGMVAEQEDTIRLLGDIEGTRVSTRDQAEAVLGIDNQADEKIRGMKSRQRARFSGSSGGTRVLGSGDAAGSY